MRNLLIAVFLMLVISVQAQTSYPCYQVDSTGKTLVVMTIEQAQALDNNMDLLQLFKKLSVQAGETDSVCLKVINEKDQVIAAQTVQIADLKSVMIVKSDKITTLQREILEKDKKITSLTTEIDNKNKEINLNLDRISTVKRNYGLGGGAIGVIVGIVTGLILLH